MISETATAEVGLPLRLGVDVICPRAEIAMRDVIFDYVAVVGGQHRMLFTFHALASVS